MMKMRPSSSGKMFEVYLPDADVVDGQLLFQSSLDPDRWFCDIKFSILSDEGHWYTPFTCGINREHLGKHRIGS